MIVFAVFMFGLMISLVVLKGLLQAQDFVKEKLKEAPLDKATGESDA